MFTAWRHPDIWAQGVANLVPLIASGAVDPYITETYPWDQVAEAYQRLEGRLTQGNLALVHTN